MIEDDDTKKNLLEEERTFIIKEVSSEKKLKEISFLNILKGINCFFLEYFSS